jgi:hypothetical protein
MKLKSELDFRQGQGVSLFTGGSRQVFELLLQLLTNSRRNKFLQE